MKMIPVMHCKDSCDQICAAAGDLRHAHPPPRSRRVHTWGTATHCLLTSCHWTPCTAFLHPPCKHGLQDSIQTARHGTRISGTSSAPAASAGGGGAAV